MIYIFIPMAIVILFCGFIVGSMFGSYLSSSFEITTGQILLGCIGMIGLAAPIYNSFLVRKHNRLQVRPLLSYDQKVKRPNENELKFLVNIKNNGLGPAIIDTCEYFYNGEKCTSVTDLSGRITEKVKKEVLYAHGYSVNFSRFIENDIIAKDDEHQVLEITIIPKEELGESSNLLNYTAEVLSGEFCKVMIKVSYKCAYNTLSKVELGSSEIYNKTDR